CGMLCFPSSIEVLNSGNSLVGCRAMVGCWKNEAEEEMHYARIKEKKYGAMPRRRNND
ncbi:hypothetical protein HAX54_033841, partial [Datura stramonium]|nr:hypothetical protein [Datura stramonium]